MQEKENFGGVGVAFCEGEQVEVVVADVEILSSRTRGNISELFLNVYSNASPWGHTFMPSSEKQGGTAELSSSASERRTGNFSTADMGMSPL